MCDSDVAAEASGGRVGLRGCTCQPGLLVTTRLRRQTKRDNFVITDNSNQIGVGQWRRSCTEGLQVKVQSEEMQTATKEVLFSVTK